MANFIHGRDMKVIFAERLAQTVAEKLRGTPLQGKPLIGTLSQVANFTAISDNGQYRENVKKLYD